MRKRWMCSDRCWLVCALSGLLLVVGCDRGSSIHSAAAPLPSFTLASYQGGLPGFRNDPVSAATWEGYWYSRYNLAAFAMKGGSGEMIADPNMMVVLGNHAARCNDANSMVVMPTNAALLQRIYDANAPQFVNAGDGDPMNFNDERWAMLVGAPAATTRRESQAWLMLKETQWAKQFHVDSHFGNPKSTVAANLAIPGANERFAGGVLFYEALKQGKHVQDNPAAYDNTPAGQAAMIWAWIDVAAMLRAVPLPLSVDNRYRLMAVDVFGPKTADQVASDFEGYASAALAALGEPVGIRDTALVVEALAWFAAHTTSMTDRATAKVRITTYANALMVAAPVDSVERAHRLRALIEAHRATTATKYRDLAVADVDALAVAYDGATGVFPDHLGYRGDDVAALLGALNSARVNLVATLTAAQMGWVKQMFGDLFESLVDRSGLQIAAPPVTALPKYEQDKLGGLEVLFRYGSTSLMPAPEAAGGLNGTAPVFAKSVTYNLVARTWSRDVTQSPVADAMRLSNEMIWFHNNEINGFPPIP